MAHEPATPGPEKQPSGPFQPFVPADQSPPEFTFKAVLFGALFGIIFGASTVYLALKAGLTVSASIPIAVLSISVLRLFGRATILENNMVQTIGSAGESVAAGVAFTVPALLFLSEGPDGKSVGEAHFEYLTIMILAAAGGILGVLFMVPLRRSLIVAEHGNLPYPEGAACADVLTAGEKGGQMARYVFGGVLLAMAYQVLNVVFAFWKETVSWVTTKAAGLGYLRTAHTVSPEYLGVGYILGIRVGGIMVSGSILTFFVLIPLLAFVIGDAELGRRLGISLENLKAGDPALESVVGYIRGNFTRYIGAGAVTMAGLITLARTLPTIWRSLRESASALRAGTQSGQLRTERDMPLWIVAVGGVALTGIIAVLPVLPDTGSWTSKLVMAALMLGFGFLFVTVSSRIVGIIGSSSNPISGMTIATLLGTCLVFLNMGLGGDINQPIALSVGAIVCIAAANAGATSQDLKTGYLVGATPIRQQIGLVIGVLVSTFVIGLTLKLIDTGYADPDNGIRHGIGTPDRFPAPQATLMATVIKGVMSQNLPWEFILIGAGLAVMVWLAGASPLAWAVGVYLPIETTLPIFIGGALRAIADKLRGQKEESEISPGMLFATGLVAGGTLTGVLSCGLTAIEHPLRDASGQVVMKNGREVLSNVLKDCQHIGESFQERMGMGNIHTLIPYAAMAAILVFIAIKKTPTTNDKP